MGTPSGSGPILKLFGRMISGGPREVTELRFRWFETRWGTIGPWAMESPGPFFVQEFSAATGMSQEVRIHG